MCPLTAQEEIHALIFSSFTMPPDSLDHVPFLHLQSQQYSIFPSPSVAFAPTVTPLSASDTRSSSGKGPGDCPEAQPG